MSNVKFSSARSINTILAPLRRFVGDDKRLTAVPESAAAVAVEQDVLELTEAIDEDGNARHLAPFGSPRPPFAREPIASAAPASTGSAAYRHLAADLNERKPVREPHLTADSVTDDLIGEQLRAFLQAWLDAHLPAIVERLVADEIARVGGRSPPGVGD
jgi:uncharacterized protein